MKRRKTRFCAGLLAAAMFFAWAPATAFAEAVEPTGTVQQSQAENTENIENTENAEAETAAPEEAPAPESADVQDAPAQEEAVQPAADEPAVQTDAPQEGTSYDGDFTSIPAKSTGTGLYSTMLDWHNGLPDSDKLYKAGKGTISWNATEHVLTLTDATVDIELVGNGAIQLPSGQDVTVKLVGNNVFTETGSNGGNINGQGFFYTSGNLTFTGDGSLTMNDSSKGLYVTKGGKITFSQEGTITINARNCGIFQYGDIDVESGNLIVRANLNSDNVWGIYQYLSNNTETVTLTINGGYVEVHADNTTGSNSGGIYGGSLYQKSAVKVHGGELLVTAAQEAILAQTIMIDGNAKVTARSENKYALLGSCTVSGNAIVDAETEKGTYAMGLTKISGSAKVTGSGDSGGVAVNASFVYEDNAIVISKGTTPSRGAMSADLQYIAKSTSKLNGCKISVDTDKSGDNAAAWDWDTTAHPLNDSTYKYIRIEKCNHTGAKSDGDCTTALKCGDCNGTLVRQGNAQHNYNQDWTDEGEGVHSRRCTNALYNGNQCEARITVRVPNTVADYDGSAHTLEEITLPEGATIQYKDATGAYTDAKPEFTELGSHTVDYKVTYAGGSDLEASATVTIQPRKINPTATLTPASFIYDGTAKEPAVTLKDGDAVIDPADYTVEYRDNTEVGTATAIIKVKPGLNITFDDITIPFKIAPQATPQPSGGSTGSNTPSTDTAASTVTTPASTPAAPTDKPTAAVPATGDATPLAQEAVLLVLSVVGMIALAVRKKCKS